MKRSRRAAEAAHRPGLTLIEVIVVIAVCGLLASLLIPAVQLARGSARQTKCSSNMRQIAIAFHSYCDVYRVFPGNMASGWHKPLKGFLEIPEEAKGADVYRCPADSVSLGIWFRQQSYYGNGGLDTQGATGFIAGGWKWIAPVDVTDGLSNTAAFSELLAFPPDAERGEVDLENPSPRVRRILNYYTAQTLPSLDDFATECEERPVDYIPIWHVRKYYTHVLPPNRKACENGPYAPPKTPIAISPVSEHPGGVNVAFGDGAVKFVQDSIDRHVWWALGTRNGGETLRDSFH
jgi:prepilin-type N-terminal cleavage/methylation domain-containing protein/prepilin-type processing-associated H-X9-DG protein